MISGLSNMSVKQLQYLTTINKIRTEVFYVSLEHQLRHYMLIFRIPIRYTQILYIHLTSFQNYNFFVMNIYSL